MEIIGNFIGFDWDKGNRNKNWINHKVSDTECEEVFFNIPLISEVDKKHSIKEERHYVLGKSNSGRLLFVVFTPRKNKIRIISARDMNRKERKDYYEYKEEDTKI
ncbi:MAG: BrnT family toxin [Candidatus Hydrogenedentota bacterium]